MLSEIREPQSNNNEIWKYVYPVVEELDVDRFARRFRLPHQSEAGLEGDRALAGGYLEQESSKRAPFDVLDELRQ